MNTQKQEGSMLPMVWYPAPAPDGSGIIVQCLSVRDIHAMVSERRWAVRASDGSYHHGTAISHKAARTKAAGVAAHLSIEDRLREGN